MTPITNCDCFSYKYSLAGCYNGDALCFLWGWNWDFICIIPVKRRSNINANQLSKFTNVSWKRTLFQPRNVETKSGLCKPSNYISNKRNMFKMRVFVDGNVTHYLICQSPISPLIPLSDIPLFLLFCISYFLPFPFLSLSSCETNVGMIIIVWVVMTCEF